MKTVDLQARAEKEVQTLKRKIATFVKNAGCCVGDITWHQDGMTYTVQVDNDGELGFDIMLIIDKSPNAVHVETKEHKGSYMWSADVYVRPCSVVTFKF